ncbi:MAG: hypothetical protein ACYC05_15775 [Sulfuricella sp.]
MNNHLETEEIKSLFERLQKVLEEHRGGNHVAGVRSAIRQLSNDGIPLHERICGARSIFRTMMGGMGTLGDFVIWNENEARRASLNHDLNELLTELWERLEC